MFHRKYTIVIGILLVGIIAYLILKNYDVTKVVKKNMDENTKRLLMEYINNMNKAFNNMTRTRMYKEEMIEDSFYIEKEFKKHLNMLAALSFDKSDENDIVYCNDLVMSLKTISLDINVQESIKRTEVLKNVFRKIKSILHKSVKNDDLLNPLCIILSVKYIMHYD